MSLELSLVCLLEDPEMFFRVSPWVLKELSYFWRRSYREAALQSCCTSRSRPFSSCPSPTIDCQSLLLHFASPLQIPYLFCEELCFTAGEKELLVPASASRKQILPTLGCSWKGWLAGLHRCLCAAFLVLWDCTQRALGWWEMGRRGPVAAGHVLRGS